MLDTCCNSRFTVTSSLSTCWLPHFSILTKSHESRKTTKAIKHPGITNRWRAVWQRTDAGTTGTGLVKSTDIQVSVWVEIYGGGRGMVVGLLGVNEGCQTAEDL